LEIADIGEDQIDFTSAFSESSNLIQEDDEEEELMDPLGIIQ
jgi:hypothetical protein